MKEVSSEIDILVQQVDMQEEVQIEYMVQAAMKRFGRVDYAVNCAGLFSVFTSFPNFPLSCSVGLGHCFEGGLRREMEEQEIEGTQLTEKQELEEQENAQQISPPNNSIS
jgi:NAD(P)-dependent dehydrogenase (short-subunit alcohol dehydrogenase family)